MTFEDLVIDRLKNLGCDRRWLWDFDMLRDAWDNSPCVLTARARNAMINIGILSLDSLLRYAPDDVARGLCLWPGTGRKTAREIVEAVEALRVLRGPPSYSHWGIFE
jgi:hypothetical protein